MHIKFILQNANENTQHWLIRKQIFHIFAMKCILHTRNNQNPYISDYKSSFKNQKFTTDVTYCYLLPHHFKKKKIFLVIYDDLGFSHTFFYVFAPSFNANVKRSTRKGEIKIEMNFERQIKELDSIAQLARQVSFLGLVLQFCCSMCVCECIAARVQHNFNAAL